MLRVGVAQLDHLLHPLVMQSTRRAAGLADLVDDVRLEHEIAVARVRREVRPVVVAGRREVVVRVRHDLVEVHEHRVLLPRLVVRRQRQRALQLAGLSRSCNRRAPCLPHAYSSMNGFASVTFFGDAKRRVRHPVVGELVEVCSVKMMRSAFSAFMTPPMFLSSQIERRRLAARRRPVSSRTSSSDRRTPRAVSGLERSMPSSSSALRRTTDHRRPVHRVRHRPGDRGARCGIGSAAPRRRPA